VGSRVELQQKMGFEMGFGKSPSVLSRIQGGAPAENGFSHLMPINLVFLTLFRHIYDN